MERDLTVGSVPKQLLSFAAPLFLANLLQSLYSIVDMAVVGRFVGSAGLAAVSSAAMLSFIIQSVCTGVTTGGAVLIAQYKGARDARGQRETTGALFSVSALAALLVTAAGLLAYRPVFTLMNLPAEALPHALRYMRVICLGTVFVFGYNAVCSVLRGLGDSKSPLFFVAVATVVNILLDLLLVGPLGLGTQGAAIATAASQGVSFLTAVVVLRRRGLPLVFSPAYFRTAPKTCCAILRIGFPAAVQMAVLNLSYLLVTGMLNGYGVAVAAAAGVGLKVNSFAAMPCWAVGQAVTTMAGQNLGAGDTGRAAQTARSGLRLALLVTAASILAVQLFTAQIIGFFNTDPEVVREGVFYLRVCCSFNSLVYRRRALPSRPPPGLPPAPLRPAGRSANGTSPAPQVCTPPRTCPSPDRSTPSPPHTVRSCPARSQPSARPARSLPPPRRRNVPPAGPRHHKCARRRSRSSSP